MSKTIAIDCDDTLANTREHFLAFHNHTINGHLITKEKRIDFSGINLGIGLTREQLDQLVREFFRSDAYIQINTLPYATDMLTKWKQSGHRLVIVTGRHDDMRQKTEQWLDKRCNWLWDDLIMANHYGKNAQKKTDICQQIGASYLLDDALHNMVDIETVGVQGILIPQPRNTIFNPVNYPNVIKVHGWDEIVIE